MNENHTPGPWHVHEGPNHFIGSCGEEGYHIDLEVWAKEHFDANGDDHNEICINIPCEDDARLIAAAPDLLAACETVLKNLRRIIVPTDYEQQGICILESAMAKAEGHAMNQKEAQFSLTPMQEKERAILRNHRADIERIALGRGMLKDAELIRGVFTVTLADMILRECDAKDPANQ